MEVRTPAVSGTFYPGDEKELKDLIHECFLHELGPGKIHLQILIKRFTV